MRKIVLIAMIAAAFAVLSPAQAVPPECVALGQGQSFSAVTCSYTATGAGTYAASTPNSWKIYALRDTDGNPLTPPVEVILASSGTLGVPGSGPLASLSGETVYLQLNWACVPGTEEYDGCGHLGFVSAGNN